MRKYLLLLIILLSEISYSQYDIKSPYLKNTENIKGYVDSCAKFWLKSYDNVNGGFYHNVNRSGNPSKDAVKRIQTQARHSYGYTRAFMLTGNEAYLDIARKTLDFIYKYAWDTTYGGWYNRIDISGNNGKTNNKTAFDQHYALLGISAYCEVTNNPLDWEWLTKGYSNNQNKFWDSRPGFEGYYDEANYTLTSRSGKSFNATVDAVTTHLIGLTLMTSGDTYLEKLTAVAENMLNRLAASMDSQKMGFVEEFDSDWNPDNSQTMTIMGHVLKTAWCLGRIHQLSPNKKYIDAAIKLADHVLDKGYDHQYGGPFKDYNRVTGQMLMWGNPDTAKAWWQMQQGVMAGLELFDITHNDKYLEMADETLDFFMKYFVDHQYGEVYQDRTRRGAQTWGTDKGNENKASYHSIELGYYTYLYGNLFVHNKPVALYYKFEEFPHDREITLLPLAIQENRVRIKEVAYNNEAYYGFNSENRTVTVPHGTSGVYKVTFEPVDVTGIAYNDQTQPAEYRLDQNYPNPFNPSTTISYQIPKESFVSLKVYDILGKEVQTLINEFQNAGNHNVVFNGPDLSSGVYFYTLKTGEFKKTNKLILQK